MTWPKAAASAAALARRYSRSGLPAAEVAVQCLTPAEVARDPLRRLALAAVSEAAAAPLACRRAAWSVAAEVLARSASRARILG